MSNGSARLLATPLATFSALTLIAASAANAEVLELRKSIGGTTVDYMVVLPDDYDPEQTYPGIVVFGGGPQTIQTIEGTIRRNFRDEAERRGYIVIGPAAPDRVVFFQGSERVLPTFLNRILRDYNIEQAKFHLAGPSNGGITAMYIAARYPDYVLSATTFPGYTWQPSEAKLDAIAAAGICVFMYVGELDEYRWHDEMRAEVAYLDARGIVARYSLEEGQGHRIQTVADENAYRLFDGFEQARQGCTR